ncbi:MAG: ParB/RepB/Spo0J family partition protein [Gallionella sp.]|jgi:ParB/RepB/Spo0J family partition protein
MISLKEVPLCSITYGERFREDLGDLSELIFSMKKEGIIQPLAVRDNEDGTYLLLAGGRRYTAATKAGFETVPVRCYPASLSELERRSIELAENIYRKDLDWKDRAKLSKEIYELQVAIHGEKISTAEDAPGVSKRDVADLLGKSHVSLIKDIQRARALEIFPDLGKAKNASDADKMISKMQEEIIRGEMAKRIQEQTANTPIEQVHQKLLSQYFVGDFFSGIASVPNGSIDFIELDPPYAIDLTNQKRDMTTGYTANYNEVDVENYPEFLSKVLFECNRVMSNSSWMIVWHAKQWREVIKNLLTLYNLQGDEGIWYKGNVGQTNNPNVHLASCFEPFLYVRKGNPNIIRQGRSNVFYYKPVASAKKSHPTERPIEMIQDMMQTFCWEGARIAVPFLGSGNSILAASNLGMLAFGWDLSQEYKDSYIIKVSGSKPGAYRSYKEEGGCQS